MNSNIYIRNTIISINNYQICLQDNPFCMNSNLFFKQPTDHKPPVTS